MEGGERVPTTTKERPVKKMVRKTKQVKRIKEKN